MVSKFNTSVDVIGFLGFSNTIRKKNRFPEMLRFFRMSHYVREGGRSKLSLTSRYQTYRNPKDHKIKHDPDRISDFTNIPPLINSTNLLNFMNGFAGDNPGDTIKISASETPSRSRCETASGRISGKKYITDHIPLVLNRKILETEYTITRNICIQHLTHRRVHKWLMQEPLMIMA